MIRFTWVVLYLLMIIGLTQAQVSDERVDPEITRWALPDGTCGWCIVQISEDGTLVWYSSNPSTLHVQEIGHTYRTYDLTEYVWDVIPIVHDIEVFLDLNYVIFFSPPGGRRTLSRYNLETQSLELFEFPYGYDLIRCNWYTPTIQQTRRHIFRVGQANHMVACTRSPSPDGELVINIIDVERWEIDQMFAIEGSYYHQSYNTPYRIVGGHSNEIYFMQLPEQFASSFTLPAYDEETEEIVFGYDIVAQSWSTYVKPRERTFYAHTTLANDAGSLFVNEIDTNTRELIHFDTTYGIVNRYPNLGFFLGTDAQGNVYFRKRLTDENIEIVIMNLAPYLGE
ncbi:MAG: hypothetical protein AAFV98_08245 [Chloroflexota bacterium]